MPAAASAPANQGMTAQQQNAAARRLILQGMSQNGVIIPPAIDMWQPLNISVPSNAGPGTVITFNIRPVGIIKRLLIRFTATVTAGASSTQTLTSSNGKGFGLANLISNVTVWDFGNQTRINTTGWHLYTLASLKRRKAFGAAYTNDSPNGFGNNNNRVMYAPNTINANGTSEIDLYVEIPFVRTDTDLRGFLFGDVQNVNAQVQITLNPNMFVSSTADPTLAVYQSGGSDLASLSAVSMYVQQNYLDQLPSQGGVPILPGLDLATAYLLNTSVSTLPVATQPNSTAFINARVFQSLCYYYDNNGTLNVNGSDITSVQLQSANFTNILNYDGKTLGLINRNIFQDDPPASQYVLDFRHRPIDTQTYGNMQVVITPSSVGGSAAFFGFGWEAYGTIGQVNQGGSIPSGA
jgi:hypothetical protein